MDLGRTQSIDTLVRHREAVEQRLSSSLRQAEHVNGALAELDHQLTDVGQARADHALRASARALLAVAAGEETYDATLILDGAHLVVRVRNTLFGLQADVVDHVDHAAARPTEGPSVQPAPEQPASGGQSERTEPPDRPGPEPEHGQHLGATVQAVDLEDGVQPGQLEELGHSGEDVGDDDAAAVLALPLADGDDSAQGGAVQIGHGAQVDNEPAGLLSVDGMQPVIAKRGDSGDVKLTLGVHDVLVIGHDSLTSHARAQGTSAP